LGKIRAGLFLSTIPRGKPRGIVDKNKKTPSKMKELNEYLS